MAAGLPGGRNPSTEASIMLVLSRKVGERILIGKDIVVTVTRIGSKNVKIGVEAPDQVNIVREELENGCDDGKRDNAEDGKAA
jgi:carbon storage regulator